MESLIKMEVNWPMLARIETYMRITILDKHLWGITFFIPCGMTFLSPLVTSICGEKLFPHLRNFISLVRKKFFSTHAGHLWCQKAIPRGIKKWSLTSAYRGLLFSYKFLFVPTLVKERLKTSHSFWRVIKRQKKVS